MRACVLRNRQLVIDDVEEPAPGPGQVLVETIACGICGSDLHLLQHWDLVIESSRAAGRSVFDVAGDLVMGHEFSARVLGLGAGVDNVQAGDTVVALPVVLTPEGPATVGYSPNYPGGYGERMVLLAPVCFKVPDGLDPRHAALTEPMAVGVHAVAKSGIQPGDAAVVLGCGPIGLAVIGALRIAGIEPIVAADFSPARRKLALHMGAYEAVDPRQEQAIDAWQRVDGEKPLVIFECVGVKGMLADAMVAAPQNARIAVAGVCLEPDTIQPLVGINKELSVQFCLGYTPEEFGRTLELIASGDLDVAPLITGEVGIAGVPAAFEALRNPEEHAKILVEPALG